MKLKKREINNLRKEIRRLIKADPSLTYSDLVRELNNRGFTKANGKPLTLSMVAKHAQKRNKLGYSGQQNKNKEPVVKFNFPKYESYPDETVKTNETVSSRSLPIWMVMGLSIGAIVAVEIFIVIVRNHV